MKALRYHGRLDLRMDEVPEPPCGADEIKIRPAFAGICGSVSIDLHEYTAGPVLFPTKPHVLTGEKIPLVMGHEFCGMVDAVGADIVDISVGDRVVGFPLLSDNTCGACLRGYNSCCDKVGLIGGTGCGGGFSEAIVLPRANVVRPHDAFSLKTAALIEPLSVAWHAVGLVSIYPEDYVLIMGGGPIGLAVLLALQAQGHHNIIVSEISSKRKQFAKKLGARHVLDPTEDNISAQCQELSEDRGIAVAFDTAGSAVGLQQGFQALRARGTVVGVALWEQPPAVGLNGLVQKEKRYIGSAVYSKNEFEQVIEAINTGILRADALITSVIEFQDVIDGGFKELVARKDAHVKILIEVNKMDESDSSQCQDTATTLETPSI